ncbi:MAG: ParB-like protein partition protein [Candidatus Jorgensenbacteria bacterium GW2011_GWA1_48_11]|uniref:ParB-like protein partition protein n=1 Tax=Candidatus Jorgensenbacteria bacterium GW2011_GWA1_48_11 TaxID=1618660 RepID=A0A0G1WLJ3_9BACT|nr:MAG: ParB-like protein partition protein [Candidatus Jorgensenbacteria bacterium GW2011_GWA1_48_11]KKW11875.1 MAG: ParB-like protein partition protein [Candidatus Jorgensenbacteria bacterium GW2011_GWB1_49_9]
MLKLDQMSLIGRGLESLIPKKRTTDAGNSFSKDAVVSPQRGETPFVPQSRSFRFAEHPARSISDTLFQTNSPHHGEGGDKSWRPRVSASTKKTPDSESVFNIEVEKIKSNPLQPRKTFDPASVEELAQSIREFGIIQPIVVSKVVRETDYGTAVEYQLIAGERRLMAAKLLGLERVPAIVKKIDEHRVRLEMALIENIQRRDLNSLEEAKAYARLQDEFGLVQREIAARVGKSREVVANTLRLLNLPPHIQDALVSGKISESQARTLLVIQNPEEQNRVFKNILEDKLSVREMRTRIQKPFAHDPESRFWENKIEEKLGAPVKIRKSNGRGKMTVQFHSEDEWQGIVGKILGDEA